MGDGKAKILYGSTESEQKSKSAYYTRGIFTEYAVKQTCEKLFDNRIKDIEKSLKIDNHELACKAIDYLLDFKVADLT